jgi:hypothetical protein
MISPELAKELKDTDFPHEWCTHPVEFGWLECVPSLEKLIEACGPKNFQLTADADGTWTARSFITATSATGSTPEEATARLWLAHDHTKV